MPTLFSTTFVGARGPVFRGPARRACAAVLLALSSTVSALEATPVAAQQVGGQTPPSPAASPADASTTAAPVTDGQPSADPSASDGAAAVPPPQSADAPTVLVLETAIYGIDPVVGRYVTSTLRQTAAQMGYALVDEATARQAAAAVRMPYPPAPADLWRATWAARAARGLFARAWAQAGQYVVELTVASADGGGPFFARGSAGSRDLVAVVAALVRQALPAPGVSTAPAGGLPGSSTPRGGGTVAAGAGGAGPGAVANDEVVARSRGRRGRVRRWVLSGRFDSAFGLSEDSFYNALLGVRVDYRFTPDLRLGASLSYANLRAKDGRGHNFLFLLHFEDRVRIARGSPIRIPLRVGLGYLPHNGPVVRLAAGLGIPIGRRWELDFDLLAPTFWVIPNKTLVSLDLAAQVGYRF
jgi:hypothetical protein